MQEKRRFCSWEGPVVYRVCVSATISELSEARRNSQECGCFLATSRTIMIHWSQGGSCLLAQPGLPSARPHSSSLLCSGAKLGTDETWNRSALCIAARTEAAKSAHQPARKAHSPGLAPSQTPFVVLQCPVIEALHWEYI